MLFRKLLNAHKPHLNFSLLARPAHKKEIVVLDGLPDVKITVKSIR